MFARIFVFGLLGPLALIVGCAGPSSDSGITEVLPAPNAPQPDETIESQKGLRTKEITLAVSGMT